MGIDSRGLEEGFDFSENTNIVNADWDFVLTYTGNEVHLYNPQPEQISLFDIAYQLANKPRWNGVIEDSVAKHSLIVEAIAEHKGLGKEDRLLALMHDAAEAYIGDVPAPIKVRMDRSDFFITCEEKLENAISKRFDLKDLHNWDRNEVLKLADKQALWLEVDKNQLHSEHFSQLLSRGEIQSLYKVAQGILDIEDKRFLENMFIRKFEELKGEDFAIYKVGKISLVGTDKRSMKIYTKGKVTDFYEYSKDTFGKLSL